MFILYGLKNCDSCRKALKWMTGQGIAHRFHDIRSHGLGADRIKSWTGVLGWEAVLNRRSTTWRQIPESARNDLDESSAVALMAANPTLVKRPVIETANATLVGFTKDTEAALTKAAGLS